jgi:hypothetical protein
MSNSIVGRRFNNELKGHDYPSPHLAAFHLTRERLCRHEAPRSVRIAVKGTRFVGYARVTS